MYKTRRRALLIDRLSTGLITVVGLSVILAVAGMMLFLVLSSWPLFRKESLQPSGQLTQLNRSADINAGELLIDEAAPVAFVLPRSAGQDCLIRVQAIELPTASSGSPTSSAAPFKKQYRLINQTERGSITADAPDSQPAPNFKFDSLSTTPPQKAEQSLLECKSLGDGHLLIRDGQTLISGRVVLARTFLSSEQLAQFTNESRQLLKERRWTTNGEDIIVKPSAQSPAAQLSLQFEAHWSLADFFTETSLKSLNDVRFIRRTGKKDGVLIIPVQSADSSIRLRWALLSTTENDITGQTTTALTDLSFPELIPLTSPEQVNPFWIEGRFLVIAASPTSFKAIDRDDSQLNPLTLNVPEGLGSLSRSVGIYGGAALFAELTVDNQRTRCASLDAGRGIRMASASSDGQADLPVLWSDFCSASEKLIVHPHQRAVYRWLPASAQSKLSTVLLEARELTTGRIAATSNVPADSSQTALIDNRGNMIGWVEPAVSGLNLLQFNAPHLDVSLKSLFSKVRYESYEEASYSWQSTSGSDEFQTKVSLIPLIWGTVKATLYSLLFAVPLAIFAAIYSSEILDRQTRNVVKPTLEMMASVPSVVLGFLAAIVIAPWVETHILSVLLIGISMPFMLYAGGVFMQIPSARHLATRGLYASRRLLVWVILGFSSMIWLLSRAGLWIEKTAFGGDLKAFLSGGPGTEGVLWGLLLLPLVFIGLWSLPVRRARSVFRISVFFLGPVVSVWLGSMLSSHTTIRDNVLGMYAQRNTLVIAIAMGFAIIPIIYSLAEDALTSVPNSLRAGSLACGASVWQTTARVVLPTAASGLFSAVMVGLGRGIGETMIAVMATGNTAVMTLNPFDGLRSLAANIAVELPEAAQGSTHYRILFLSALVLFVFTFTLNSFAEFLRARYRARNKAL